MHHIFAADIGGTHCRLAAFSATEGRLTLHASHTVPTAQVPHTAALLQAFVCHVAPPSLPASQPLQDVDMLAVAVAGPLRDSMRASTTNAALSIDMEVALRAGCKHSLLCNDFAAQAWACCSPAMADALPVLRPCLARPTVPHSLASSAVQSPLAHSDNPVDTPFDARTAHTAGTCASAAAPLAAADLLARGVIGAGTGLGTASLLPLGNGKYCVGAAEAGHTAFAFASTEETGPDELSEKAYEAFLLRKLHTSYASAEDVVSGRGLCHLHQFLTGQDLSAATIAAHHLQENSPTCRYFARFLGRVCRHWALSTLCKGGLYITGGVAMKNPVLVCCPDFAQSFWDSPVCGELLHTIPVFLNTCEDSGLWGAATAGMHALRG